MGVSGATGCGHTTVGSRSRLPPTGYFVLSTEYGVLSTEPRSWVGAFMDISISSGAANFIKNLGENFE